VSGSRARAQPSASPDPARGRQAAPSVVRSSQPHRSGNRTLAEALAAARAMARYPPLPGPLKYETWRDELYAHSEFARLHQDLARTRSLTQQGPRRGAERTQTIASGRVPEPAPQLCPRGGAEELGAAGPRREGWGERPTAGPFRAGAPRPVDLDRASVGSSADPSRQRAEDRRGNSAVANEALVREYLQQLRSQVVGMAEPNTEGAGEAGATALEYEGGCLTYTPALWQVA
jgi:hypothetical protein